MEIISYVGGRPDNRQRIFNLNIFFLFRKLKKYSARKLPQSSFRKKFKTDFASSIKSYNTFNNNSIFSATYNNGYKTKIFSLPQIHIYPRKILKAVGRTWWCLPVLAILIFIPISMYKVMSYLESRTNPLVFQSQEKTELEVLEKEMERVALSNTISVKEDGSISNSEIIYNFKEPVVYKNYTVKKGDTISGITKLFKLNNISTIIAVNKIENVRALNAGKKIIVPSIDGLLYKVDSGDTINFIAKKYNVSVEDLLDVNDLESEVLVAGKELFIPGAKLSQQALRSALGEHFINPLKTSFYRLTSGFGYRADPFTGVRQYHPGIDMAISQGSPIYASLAGKVAFCGWSNLYGNYIIIDHGNGYQSLYGHLYKKLCTVNQEVNAGTKIGLVGSTGYSTGPHLHFTIYKNGKPVDPLTLIK